MCLRSTSMPLAALIASTTSAGPMEPKSRPPPAARAAIGMTAPASSVAWASAAPRSCASRRSRPAPHLLGLALDALGGHDGPALGQQEVAGEAARHLDDVTPAPDAGDVVAQQDLHASAPGLGGAPRRPRPRPPPRRPPRPPRRRPASVSASPWASVVVGHLDRRPAARGASAGTESPSVRSPRSRPPRPPGRSVTVRCV